METLIEQIQALEEKILQILRDDSLFKGVSTELIPVEQITDLPTAVVSLRSFSEVSPTNTTAVHHSTNITFDFQAYADLSEERENRDYKYKIFSAVMKTMEREMVRDIPIISLSINNIEKNPVVRENQITLMEYTATITYGLRGTL